MAQKSRSKELWLIPKRGSLHQTICLIEGIYERGYDKTSWNAGKQNNLGVNLKNWGATRTGKNISPQAIRTLAASLPQYLGFLYINTMTTPNSICITEAGQRLLKRHISDLVKVKNLKEGESKIIKKSEIVLMQMEKLQITNPIILKDCKNIWVFPFRMTLKLLLELNYLDREEIAYFLFKTKDESEFLLTLTEIQNFRQFSRERRINLIKAFSQTHIGNITLVQAPSASYYEALCQTTGIIDRITINPKNLNKEIKAIKINEKYIEYVKDVVFSRYPQISIYDFGENVKLWIDYIGNPERMSPPIRVTIKNRTKKEYLLKLEKDEAIESLDLIVNGENKEYPMFVNEKYDIVLIDIENGEEVYREGFIPNENNNTLSISNKKECNTKQKSAKDIAKTILDHSKASTFSGEALNYLTVIKKVIGIDKTKDKALRGAYYEFFFFQFLQKLKQEGLVDDVIWNGKIGKYGLPIQAPGGKTGTADIIFTIGNTKYVLELTTIKSKSGQSNAEIFSVPDHIRLFKEDKKEIVGIFCAPLIHERNTAVMKSVLSKYVIRLECLTDSELIDKLLKKEL